MLEDLAAYMVIAPVAASLALAVLGLLWAGRGRGPAPVRVDARTPRRPRR